MSCHGGHNLALQHRDVSGRVHHCFVWEEHKIAPAMSWEASPHSHPLLLSVAAECVTRIEAIRCTPPHPSEKRIRSQSCSVQCWYMLQKRILSSIVLGVRRGFLAFLQTLKPSFFWRISCILLTLRLQRQVVGFHFCHFYAWTGSNRPSHGVKVSIRALESALVAFELQ